MKIAILGMGTVGSGVIKVIQENQVEIQQLPMKRLKFHMCLLKRLITSMTRIFEM